MNPNEILNELDSLIQARSILNHPFYISWQRGELSREQLGMYAAIYYPHVAAFPNYLQLAIDNSKDVSVSAELKDNLADELTHPKPHPELWLDFAEEFEQERTDVTNATPHPAATQIVRTFERLAQDQSIRGLAALYAYESQQPEVARRKADGLRQLYGVENPNALAYFNVHAAADIEHREGERQAMLRCLENGSSTDERFEATEQALDAYWKLLDGICQEAEIPLAC